MKAGGKNENIPKNEELSEKESDQLKEDIESLSHTDSNVLWFWVKILSKSNNIKDKPRKENTIILIER